MKVESICSLPIPEGLIRIRVASSSFATCREAPSELVGFPVRHPAHATVLQPSQGARPGSTKKFLFFQAEPTKKLPELPESPETQTWSWLQPAQKYPSRRRSLLGRGQLGQLFSRSKEQM
jgi:hypothetical protein